MTTVAVIEDSTNDVKLFGDLCRLAGIKLVASYGSGEDALANHKDDTSDVLFVDLGLPCLSGPELTKQLRKKFPRAKIAVMSGTKDPDSFGRCQPYVNGFFVKNYLRGEAPRFAHLVSRLMDGHYVLNDDAAPLAFAPKVPLPDLTPFERKVLTAASIGQSAKEIGGAYQMSENTVKSHLQHIRDKCGASSTEEAAHLYGL